LIYRAVINIDRFGHPSLSENEMHHLVRVRRLSAGDVFLGLHLEEAVWYRCVLSQGGKSLGIKIEQPVGMVAESPLRIVLGVALIKKDKFEWMIQKACEMGVQEIIPLQTRYVEKSRLLGVQRSRLRWKKIMEESVKQCGRSRIPLLGSLRNTEELLQRPLPDLRVVLDPKSKKSFKEVLVKPALKIPRELILFTGPEGGWSDEELELFRLHEARVIHIGPRILRAETAVLAALSVAQFLWGDVTLRSKFVPYS